MSTVTETAVAEAIIALMRGPAGDGRVDETLARTVGVAIRPALLKAYGARAPADLSGDLTFKTLVSTHIGQSPAASEEQQRQALLRAIQTGNVTGAEYSAAVVTAARTPHIAGYLAARLAGAGPHEGRAGHASSAERSLGLGGGYFTANNLSSDLRAFVDGPRATAGQVASAANFAHGLGIDPNRYAGHFVGASSVAKEAIAAHIRSGAKLTDEHITNMKDARAVIAAVQAGKIKKEDAPPSVQKVVSAS